MAIPYNVRPAQPADLDPLVDLLLDLQEHVETANTELWRMTAKARGNLKGQLSARLGASRSYALVAEHEEDGVVGIIFGRITINKRYTPSATGFVDQLFVREDHRRSAVGSQLVAALCQFFADENVDDLSLRYAVGNEEAAAFWSSLGFSPRIITAGAGRQAVEAHLARTLKR